MTKIQVDIPDAWLDDLRRIFDKRVGSTEIPIANCHLVRWCVEQYRKGASLGTSEDIPETHEAHEETPYNPEDDIPIDEWMEMRRTENL